MLNFKFLTDNEDEDISAWDNLFADGDDEIRRDNLLSSPSWMWDDDTYTIFNPDTQPYEFVGVMCNGINDFLARFPPGYIVVVHRIEGIDSRIVHTANSERIGWGFDIQNDLLEVTYYRFLNTDHA